MIITFIIILLVSIILIFILYNKVKNKNEEIGKLKTKNKVLEDAKLAEIKNYFQEEWDKREKELEYKRKLHETDIRNSTAQLENQYKLDASEYNGKIRSLEVKLKEKETRYDEVNQDLDLYKKGKIEEIDRTAAEYKQHQQTIIKEELEKYREHWTDKFNNELVKISESRDKALDELKEITINLEIERSKRAAINEEIRRQREIEEQQDFYRIQIDENSINDVEILRSVAPRLQHPDAINKIIWSAYYQKPLAELRKRVAIEGSGVYKITRIKTGEIYIGQAVNVSTRWTEHCKAALGVGTLTSSQLHRVMRKDGPENFTFELLEEVPKDKLRERESYYIDFYDSKNYGLNSISGDKK